MAKEVGLKSVKDIGKLSMFSKQLSENVKKEGLLINQFSIKDLPEDEQNRSLYYVFIDENQD
jgi:porphobilinogen deaminase